MRRRLIGLALGLGLFATAAAAQPIHGHPQKAAYGSSAEYPTISAQGHWVRADTGQMIADMSDNGDFEHLHNDLTCPYLGEFKGGDTITCKQAITLRNFAGHVIGYAAGANNVYASTLVWDATGTDQAPAMVGDPNDGESLPPAGILTFTATFRFTVPSGLAGWQAIASGVTAALDDGTTLVVQTLVPYWDTDPYQGGDVAQFPLVRSSVRVHSGRNPDVDYGYTNVDYAGLLPLAPIVSRWTGKVSGYSYGGATALPANMTEERVDFDFHNNKPGTVLWATSGPGDQVDQTLIFDPASTSAGIHKFGAFRTVMLEGDMHMGLLVVSVPVGVFDPTAAPVGDPLPPPMPMPPPPPMPTTLACVGTVTGTSTNGGMDVTPTSAIVWSCQ